MRVVICWIGVSGYLAASWRALAGRAGLDVKVLFLPGVGTAHAPFDASLTEGIPAEALTAEQADDAAYVAARVLEHKPDVVVIPGWVIKGYTALAFNPALASARFVMGIDNPLKTDRRGRFRQALGRFKLRRLLRRMDRIVVPGERGYQYARFLGFNESQVRRGVYGIDYEQFAPLFERRLNENGGAWPKRFLFAGRYEPAKGLETLVAAYDVYRRRHGDEAWPLTCCGKGPLSGVIASAGAGVEDRGFVQPRDQPALWASCGAFVLASRYDPWPLVVVEACAAGLPVLCTEACGSAVELVRPHFNGLTVATDDAADLARGLSVIHDSYDRLPEMGRAGQGLAAAYSARAFADRWDAMFCELSGGR